MHHLSSKRFSTYKKVFLLLFLFLSIVLSTFTLVAQRTFAQDRSYVYESVDVTLDQNKDSTMVVTEEITYRFNGTYSAVFRDIALENETKVSSCKSNANLQCGGFEFMQIVEVRDGEGNLLKPAREEDTRNDSEGRLIADSDKYLVVTTQENGNKYFRIQWLFAEDGRAFNNETLTFTVKYLVFGAPGFFEDYDLLYWNTVMADREVVVENLDITINYPGLVDTSPKSLQIPGHGTDYDVITENSGSTVKINKKNILPYENFTVLHRLPKGLIDEYVTLNLDLSPRTQNVVINENLTLSAIGNRLAGLPAGELNLEFSADKRIPETVELEMEPGEERDLKVVLSLTREEYVKVVIYIALNILGFLVIIPGLIFVYRMWHSKGRDQTQKRVIVPEYKPPNDIHPYILGSLKDEQVDMVDITATIIDLAYRGYIKIIEYEAKQILGIKIKKTDFELLKLKDYSDLTEPERELMDALFINKDRVTLSDVQKSFYTKYPDIKTKIYEEMVIQNYFEKNPDKVRLKYIAIAVLIIALAMALTFANGIIPIFIGIAISLGMIGIVLAIVSKHMPSKTEIGSEIFHKVLGFKMYMETAEKYRVQNLTPETFEKYLSYAIVFGIEKQWAEKFKDIYKGKPDWYEGGSRTFDTIYLANAMSTFSTTATAAMTTSVSTSGGTASGGGWSGGGGFSGGFSGGGGGGGGGGAW